MALLAVPRPALFGAVGLPSGDVEAYAALACFALELPWKVGQDPGIAGIVEFEQCLCGPLEFLCFVSGGCHLRRDGEGWTWDHARARGDADDCPGLLFSGQCAAGEDDAAIESVVVCHGPFDIWDPSSEQQKPVGMRAIERLTDYLIRGNDDPLMAIDKIVAKAEQWSWLREPSVRDDLWIAIAGYASEHGYPSHASLAFQRLVKSNAKPEGRWRALAGITLVDHDAPHARTHLEAAVSLPGGRLLAAVGLAALDAHASGLRGPIPLPEAVSQALAAQTLRRLKRRLCSSPQTRRWPLVS